MVQIPGSLLPISASEVTLYNCIDPLLSNLPILVFHGPSTTINHTNSNSRIQIHIMHPGGPISYPRLTVSPNSPIYAVVDELPREWQGDEICRGLAFGIMKYFGEMSEAVKAVLMMKNVASQRGRRPGSAIPLFGKQHAAQIASSLVKVENNREIIRDVESALQNQIISNVDMDVVLPPGSIKPIEELLDEARNMDDEHEDFDPTVHQYGMYAPFVKLLGETAFLPTSKAKRAPSRPQSLNRSRSFLRDQKLSLRREMGEFVDTEERYLIKIHELVNNIAEDFRKKAKDRAPGSSSPSEEDIKKLFPPSLDRILRRNKGFLAAIQKVMDETEEEAMQDLEDDQPMFLSSRFSGTSQSRNKDPTGATAFGRVLLEWFPKLSDCYQEYIRASQDFPALITRFARHPSSFSSRVQQTGEQKLRSAIIEPVQRLPRYSLFIDNIVNYLPVAHPALKSMLGARDIITAICSLDPLDADNSRTLTRLKNVVGKWPQPVAPKGRLISAADFVELPPPYPAPEDMIGSNTGILLLFADGIAVLKKNRDAAISARGVMAEVDKPSAASMMASVTVGAGSQNGPDLAFAEYYPLASVRFTESEDGRTTWMTAAAALDRDPAGACRRAFLLRGAHEGKAYKWNEEVTKTRIEGRFDEKERLSDKWEMRHTYIKDAGLNIYTAVYEEGLDYLVEGRKEPAPLRIVVDRERGTKGAPVGHYGVEIVANLTVTETSGCLSYHFKFDGLNDRTYSDFADDATFMSVFTKRVTILLQNQLQAKNPALTNSFIAYYTDILTSLNIRFQAVDKTKPQRPASPAKLLSGFFMGGSLLSGSSSEGSKLSKRTLVLGNIPNFTPPSLSRSSSKKDIVSPDRPESISAANSFRLSVDEGTSTNPLVKLEETFTGYVAALQERKGNVVGRTIRNRASGDELSVNAIYNKFIENPLDGKAAMEVPVDVLFCAFEKFLHMAWHDQMGPVISTQLLEELQMKSARLFPGDFAEYIKLIFSDMAPQNKRAFVAIIKLLADLLDGCGNDGDRGALTAAFTEMLVVDENPHRYMNLLDRMVEDSDRLFEDLGMGSYSGVDASSTHGSINASMRSQVSHQSGSLTSNTSSFRKRWGFDSLLRTNSKSKDVNKDEERPSVWRTLSKPNRYATTGDATPTGGSLSKGSLHRSKSIDAGRPLSPQRPNSGARPTVIGAFDERPNTSHAQSRLNGAPTSPLREDTTEREKSKRSRRSSLSDLKTLMTEVAIEGSPAPISPPKADRIPRLGYNYNTSPRTPSPSKPALERASVYINSPKFTENVGGSVRGIGGMTQQATSPRAKENYGYGGSLRGTSNLPERPRSPRLKGNAGLNGSLRSSKSGLAGRANSPVLKENAGLSGSLRSSRQLGEWPINLPPDDVVAINDLWTSPKTAVAKPMNALSNIPLLSNIPNKPRPLAPAPVFGKPAFSTTLAQRKTTGPTSIPVPTSRVSPQKLRLQSPQKLRERLQNEASAIKDAEASLQSELSKIGEEMARLCNNHSGVGRNNSVNNNSNIGDLRGLTDTVKSMESRIPVIIKDLNARNDAIRKEMDKSLVAAETKVKGLDQLYKEASAENELLYERFNNELGKIVKALQSKNKDEKVEIMTKMKKALEETARTKKDNARLKREMVSLRTLLRAQEHK